MITLGLIVSGALAVTSLGRSALAFRSLKLARRDFDAAVEVEVDRRRQREVHW